MMSKVDEVEATCTTDGNIDYWLCNTCQLMFADDAGQQQLNEEDIVVRATGHAWDEGQIKQGNEPTCNGKGRTYELEIVESDDAFAACNTVIRDLKKNTCYKARVRAFVNVDGEKVYVKNGMVIHCHTSGGSKKYTYPKAVKVNKTKLTLKKGKSTQIKAYAVKKDKSKRLLRDPHVATLRYKSSNTKVATVSKSGRILAQGKGTCKVYVIARNGVRKAVTVKVK